MIALLQTALMKEIEDLKKGKGGRQFDVYDGQRIYSSREMHIYRFITDLSLKDDTPISVTIGDQSTNGYVVSSDPEGINIGLEADKGEFVQKATIHSSSYKLLEDLVSKLKNVRSGDISLNLEGSMKLFGFLESNRLSDPIPSSQETTEGYTPNTEQQIAILKSLTQEVTFIWGPPGTGKTKTLGIILNHLIKAGKSVLLTSHTNAAVDEILKKFIENEENAPHLEADEIVRLGTPSVSHERINDLLIDTILEKQTSEKQRRIEDLGVHIDSIHKKITEFKALEKDACAKNALLKTQTREYDREEATIAKIRRKIASLNTEIEDTKTDLLSQHQLLEKARTTNFLKRLFLGLNVERIRRHINASETRLDLSKLELQSFESQLSGSREKRDAISSRMNQLRNHLQKIVASHGLTSLESFQNGINDLSREVKEKEQEMRRTQATIETTKESILNNALVVGCTLTRAYLDSKVFRRKFDVLILDEASMAMLPNVFFVSGISSSHYIISGDFRQLSPISVSDNEAATMWLKRDIFVQAGIVESVSSYVDDRRIVMLREQYRMHPDICSLISDAVYDGKLKTSEETKIAKQQIAALPPLEDKALIFCDTANADPWIKRPGTSYSRLSPYSAVLSARLASMLVEKGRKKGVEINVGIVTPYSAQAQLTSKILEDEHIDQRRVMASTIHKFQGNERECVIFDVVEGQPFDPGMLTRGPFIDSEPGKLITVAISRAEGKFILVGNGRYIRSRYNANDAILQIMEKIEKDGETIDSLNILSPTFDSDIESPIIPRTGGQPPVSPFGILNEENFYDAFRHDLKVAKSSVVIVSPFVARKRLRSLINDFKSTVKKGTRVYIVTRHPTHQGTNKHRTESLIEEMRKAGVKVVIASKKIGFHEKFHEKIAVIDNSVVYHGSMNILSQADSSESMIAFRGRKTIEELMKHFNIQRIIRKYQNITGEDSSPMSIIRTIEKKLLQKTDPGTCPQCGRKLVLINGSNNLYFGCPNLSDEKCNIQKKVEKSLVKNAILSMKIKCRKCLGGHMVYRDGKFGPFLGCDQYRRSQCKSTMDFDDDLEDYANEKGPDTHTHYMAKQELEHQSVERKAQRKAKTYTVGEIRLDHPRAYERWTLEEDNSLTDRYKSGATVSQLANMHQRKPGAIRSRLKKLNLLKT